MPAILPRSKTGAAAAEDHPLFQTKRCYHKSQENASTFSRFYMQRYASRWFWAICMGMPGNFRDRYWTILGQTTFSVA